MIPRKTILLCEDNEMDVELTLTALNRFRDSQAVDVVRDGAEALDYLHRRAGYAERSAGNPMLVLLDLKMPRVDGLEVLRNIKADERLKTIPIVMLTSSRQEADLVDSYCAGANAYVVKPVDFEKFVAVVEETGAFWSQVNEPLPSHRHCP